MKQLSSFRLFVSARLLSAVGAALLFIVPADHALAQGRGSFRVNSTGDGADAAVGNGVCETATGNAVCTLRAAIQEAIANSNLDVFITFGIPTSDPGYNAQTGAWTINLGSALPDLNKFSRLEPTTMSITGPGANLLTIQRSSGSFRIFNVTTTGTVNISGLTITGGTGNYGGGIQNASSGTVSISSCILRNNSAIGGGGAVANSSNGTVAITNCTLERNGAHGGGAISNSGTLNITGSIVRLNFASNGGGGVSSGGALTVVNTTIADNRAVSSDYMSPGSGGGIFATETVTLTNSTISGNSARGTDAAPPQPAGEGWGGGIYFNSGKFGSINITNCTIAANIAEGGNGFNGGRRGAGGGILLVGIGTYNLSNSTVAGNWARGGYSAHGPALSDGGGIFFFNAGYTMNIKSTIMANNSADQSPDAGGAFTSQGFNFIGKKDGSTGFTLATDKRGTIAKPLDPKFDLKGLRNNGGLTETIALQPSSPAVDKGSSVGFTGNLTTDQRGTGFPRTVDRAPANATGGDGTDIGAFELGP